MSTFPSKLLFTVLCLIILVTASCGTPVSPVIDAATPTTPAQPTPALRELVIAEDNAPNTFDPIANSNFNNWYAWQLVYETLAEVQPDGSVKSLLATNWTVSDDRMTYQFTLRKDVTFHNGEPLEADDVVYSFTRLQEKGIPYAKSRFATLKSVVATSSSEVTFTLSAPDSAFLNNLADPFVVGSAILNREAGVVADPAMSMVGTGPFKMKSYSPGTELVLVRNENYWRSGIPNIDQLVVRYMPEQAAQFAALKANQIDVMFPSVETYQALRNDSGVQIIQIPTAQTFQINMGSDNPPLDNVDVRRAIALAIDRDAIVQTALLGQGQPTGPFPPSHPWALPLDKQPYYGRDVKRAKQLLAQAGYPKGLELTLMIPAGFSDELDRIAEVLQSQLADVGIKITIEPLETSIWLDKLAKADYDLTITAPPYFSDPLLYIVPRAGRQGPTPPKLQALLDRARGASFDDLMNIYQQIQLTEADLVYPFTGTVAKNAWVAYRPNIKGVEVNFTMSRRFIFNVSLTP